MSFQAERRSSEARPERSDFNFFFALATRFSVNFAKNILLSEKESKSLIFHVLGSRLSGLVSAFFGQNRPKFGMDDPETLAVNSSTFDQKNFSSGALRGTRSAEGRPSSELRILERSGNRAGRNSVGLRLTSFLAGRNEYIKNKDCKNPCSPIAFFELDFLLTLHIETF